MVKIYTVSSNFNYYNPWQMRSQNSSTGSGSVISGERILTNAHVVSDQTFIQVRKSGEAKKYIARVEWVSHDSDLAILKVDDKKFFQGTEPLEIGELPRIRDKVTVYGFPKGGSVLSITEGVVSRIEHRYYSHSTAYLLACQIDAAINAGNSGGPVIRENKIIGVAFQAYRSGDNIGYMVPAPVIRHFLTDIEDKRYNGIPELGLEVQAMENQDLRKYYSMSENQSGVLVKEIKYGSSALGIIQKNDIILAIEGYQVENDGTVEFREGERTFFGYLIQSKQINEKVKLRLLRHGKILEKEVTLLHKIHSHNLVPYESYDQPPSYYIYGGLLFMPLSKNLLMEWGNQWYHKAPKHLLNYYYYGNKSRERQEVVLLVKVLADPLNAGYQNWTSMVIDTVNGKKISDLRGLIRAIKSNHSDEHVIIDQENNQLVLDRKKADRFSPEILRKYQISHDRSPDLR